MEGTESRTIAGTNVVGAPKLYMAQLPKYSRMLERKT